MSSSDKPTCSRVVKSKSVNEKIVDYYLKYAKDRDIEKFMRFSSSCASKSSSSEENEYLMLVQGCGTDPAISNCALADKSDLKTDNVLIALKTPVKEYSAAYVLAPDSSTKNAKKLEWDSLADVGYKKAYSTGNISSLERSVLKELFTECPSEPNISCHRSREDKSSSSCLLNSETRRERWRQTLDTLGKKYSSLSASLETQEFIDLPQSTPKDLPSTEKFSQTTFDKKKPVFDVIPLRQDHSCQTSFDQRTAKRLQNTEKFCQTSIARLKSLEAQANLSSRRESFATQSSFEYKAGDSSSSKSSARRGVLCENNSQTSRQSSDSDKENQLIKKTNKSKSEVDLGIKLLCSLINAKNLTGTQKKSLAKKIFEKIMKQHSPSSTSTSLTSRSSVLSMQSLIDSLPVHDEETNRSGAVHLAEVKKPQKMSQPQIETENPKGYDNTPTTSPSLEEPVTTREWLHPLTRSEKDYDKKLKKKAAEVVGERQKQLTWIEVEIKRLEGLKNLLMQECPSRSQSNSSKSTTKSGGKAEVIYEETSEDVVNLEDQYKRTTHKSTHNVVIYDEPTRDDGKQPEKVEYKTTRVNVNEEQQQSSSGSLKNRRSKLETPVSSPSPESESVSAFANHLQKQFMDNYSKKKRCVSEHYSEPRICRKPIFNRNPSYTSVASSPLCTSSEMSIPIVESSSTSTTTHQYDTHGGCDSIEGVAVQTTYSVIKTNPIFGPRCKCICTCGKECKCSCPRPTVRVSGKSFHQTVQVKPKALAYVIRFSEASAKLTEEQLTLQQRLELQNPNFCIKANERREILKKLHKLREQRELKIREIAESSSVSSISRKLDQLPPPPINHVRICPTREMKNLTKRRYSKLPEVLQKQEREKLERRRRTTRVITNIFNKKLQRMVHTGKMSLEYSRTVI